MHSQLNAHRLSSSARVSSSCISRKCKPAVPLQRCRVADVKKAETAAGRYILSDMQKQAFERDGFVHLQGVFSDAELKEVIDPAYQQFLDGKIEVDGPDLCDMSPRADEDATPAEYSVFSVKMARQYYPAWQKSLVEQRSQDIACQLLAADAEDMELDFDQILAKKPRSQSSIMPWHQDAAYTPRDLAANCSTANVWLAVSDVPMEAGCMRYVPGSHKGEEVRPHTPVGTGEDVTQTLRTEVGHETAILVPMSRGDVIIHNEHVVHGSGPNMSANWRLGYVLNFKRVSCIVEERAMGFTNSANDAVAWYPYDTKEAKK